MRKPTIWVPNRSDTNRSVQSLKKIIRSLKFWTLEEEELYYPCSENKCADQLRSNCEAYLRHWFCICRFLVFSCTGSIIKIFGISKLQMRYSHCLEIKPLASTPGLVSLILGFSSLLDEISRRYLHIHMTLAVELDVKHNINQPNIANGCWNKISFSGHYIFIY